MIQLSILIAIVLSISFMCSLLEAILLSVQPAFLAIKAEKNRKYAKLMIHQRQNMDRSIGAILTINTFSHTMGAALIGSKIHQLFGAPIVTVASIVLTIAILIFTEILPKTIGASQWRYLCPFAAYCIQILLLAPNPFVWISKGIAKLFGLDGYKSLTSREEVIMTAEISAGEGGLLKKESAIIKNLLMLNRLYVSDIMTPRSVMLALEEKTTIEEVMLKYKPIRYSRIPVYCENLDHIIGMTHRYKIMEFASHDHDQVPISCLTTPIQRVSEKVTVGSLLDFFIRQKEHITLVTDEFDVITGLVSLEDAIETLLGVEIVDEFDSVVDLRQFALDQWQQRRSQIRK